MYKYEVPAGKDHKIKVTMYVVFRFSLMLTATARSDVYLTCQLFPFHRAPSIIVCLAGEGYISELEQDTEKMLPLCTGIVYCLKAATKFLLTSSPSADGIPSTDLSVVRVSVNEMVEPSSSCAIS